MHCRLALLLTMMVLAGCGDPNPQDLAHEAAQRFAQQLLAEPAQAYDLFSDELRAERGRDAFAAYIGASPHWHNASITATRVSLTNESAGYLVINTSFQDDIVLTMRHDGEHWRFFGLTTLFSSSCPVHCADGDICTHDVCNASTRFRCEHRPFAPCEGNGICEEGEYPSVDCPDCRDHNVCTDDIYDVGDGRCYHIPIEPCCGNQRCEQNETRASCPHDCAGIVFTLGRDDLEEQRLAGVSYTIKRLGLALSEMPAPLVELMINDELYRLRLGSQTMLRPGHAAMFTSIGESTDGPVAIVTIFEVG